MSNCRGYCKRVTVEFAYPVSYSILGTFLSQIQLYQPTFVDPLSLLFFLFYLHALSKQPRFSLLNHVLEFTNKILHTIHMEGRYVNSRHLTTNPPFPILSSYLKDSDMVESCLYTYKKNSAPVYKMT